MIILIPLGGIGKRFKIKGYDRPKALINVNDKPIIYYLLDNLNLNKIDYVYIPYNQVYSNYNFENKLTKDYPNIKFKFLKLKKQTKGAAETIYIALKTLFSENIRYPINSIQMKEMFDKPILCIDSDNFYTTDIISKWNGSNSIFTFFDDNPNPIFSYVKKDTNQNILNIVEKEKISNYACTGAYGFNSYYTLMEYCKKIINTNLLQKNEFYTSGVIKKMLKNNIEFKSINIKNKNYFSLGTPKQTRQFEYSFLFDLDGTLINTDPVYIKVWNTILKKYNIFCDEFFFNSFIKGKSDIDFCKFLINNISKNKLDEISLIKDKLFIEYINKNTNLIFDGVINFIKRNKNSKIAIVTSCNMKAAEYIINYFNLDEYINLLIASEDVTQHKPNPEPYILATKKLNININKCIIFEDSESGLMAAKRSNPFTICLFDNGTNKKLVQKNKSILTFNKYDEISFNNIITSKINNNNNNNISNFIKKKLSHLPIKNVFKSNDNIKTGYICNIDKYIIEYYDTTKESIIVKISNFDNELSNTAIKLGLYTNENYFYKTISPFLTCITKPKFYGLIKHNKNTGIIMEDLLQYAGSFNINLNNNVSLLLKLVNKIFIMHNRYYFKDENSISNFMKKIKRVNQNKYYLELINNRYDLFLTKNKTLLSSNDIKIMNNIYNNFKDKLDYASTFPLCFCHGDFKSANIFYRDNKEIYLLDWQYIQLNKGISDIVFLLVESINFDKKTADIVINYYYKLLQENSREISFEEYINDFKNALCIFPFFVMVWFNSEDSEKLLDKCFPIRFMKNVLLYYTYYLC